MGMNTTISFRGTIITTNSHAHAMPIHLTKPDKKRLDRRDSVRNYDCEEYLDCLFEASMANAGRLPCKGCSRYVPQY
jgi:hypothetical protein